MTRSASFQFWHAGAVDIDEITRSLPSHLQLESMSEIPGQVLLLDTFDGEIRASGRLLFQAGERIWLVDAAQSASMGQSCKTGWRFVQDLPAGAVRKCLRDVSPLRALLPVGTTQLRCTQITLLDDDAKTQVRGTFYTFEQDGHVVTIGQTSPVKGYDEAHHTVIAVLRDQGAHTVQPGGDMYAPLGFGGRYYQAKPSIPLAPDTPISETSRHIISAFLHVARENEAGIKSDDDTEFLHDYRVSLRKVRSMLSLCKGVYSTSETTRLKQAFAGMMKETNRLRDLDVYLLDQKRFFGYVPESLHEGLRTMFTTFHEERQTRHAHLVQVLESNAYTDTMRELAARFQPENELEAGPHANDRTLPFARRVIWKRYRKVGKFANNVTDHTPDHKVHSLRIQCKKLRYLMEFFTPLFPKTSVNQFIKALKRLQDNLGRFNDYAVQQRSLHTFLQEYAQQHAESLKLAESIGALVAVLYQHQAAERRQIKEHLASFYSAETRALFTAIFSDETTESEP